MTLRLENSAGESLVLARGRIAQPDTKGALTVNVGAAHFHPGLINAHDHLHRNHYPRLGSPPYEDAYAWGTDLHGRYQEEVQRAHGLDRRTALLFGAFKNIIAGVTTVVHHDAWEAAFAASFPLRVARVRTIHSLGFETDWAQARAAERTQPDLPLTIHLAEGRNSRAAGEVELLDRMGWLDNRLLAVHCVGVDDAGAARLAEARAALVWCPSSNLFLFGRTAPGSLVQSGIDVLLGSDALLTGDGTLLDELRVARATELLPDHVLLDAVGARAAQRLRLPVPSLEPGAQADLVLFRKAVLDAAPGDVAAVFVAGTCVLADAELSGLMNERPVTRMRLGGVDKLVPAELAAAAAQVAALSPECARIFQ